MNWNYTVKKLAEIKPQAKNPRKISKDQKAHLNASLEKFGVCDPLILNADGTLIAGHQRYYILRSKGILEAPCMVADESLKDKDVDELTIRHNKNTGDFDFDLLANGYDPESLLDWGFAESELEIDISVIEGREADDEILDPPKNTLAKLGTVYTLGNHRLMCGDSTNPDHVSKLLHGEEPILMVTDPPYGVNYDPTWRLKHGKRTTAVGKVKNDDQINWSLAWHLFPGSVAYIWHAAWFCSDIHKSLVDADFEIKNQIVWVKQHFALSRGDYHWQHECCWYAIKKGCSHNWQGSRKESTIWEISNLNAFGTNKEDERTAHSTQKPLDCMRIPIRNNSKKGEGIYDPFGGSGTTLLASEELSRNCFMMELDPAYCDLIIERWKKYRKKIGKSSEVTEE